MNCANHRDVAAMGVCRECGRPLCPLCVYFQDGQIVCSRHAAPGTIGATAGTDDLPGDETQADTAMAGAETAAVPDAPPGLVGTGGPMVPPGPVSTGVLAPPVPGVDPRLEPLPMSLRPGWPEEPAQPRPSTLGENMGLIGLITAVAALPFSFCCGIGAYVGAPLAVIGGGLCIAALVTAARTRNPSQARLMGGIGLGVSVLSLAISACYVVGTIWLTSSFNSTLSSILTATP